MLTKEEWIARCAKRLQDKGSHLDSKMAAECAAAGLESIDGDLSESPEDFADDELSDWRD